MKTKMSVMIVVKDCVGSRELYEELRKYKLNVTDLGSKTLVHAIVDIREPDMESILTICNKYGSCEVEAHLVEKKGS